MAVAETQALVEQFTGRCERLGVRVHRCAPTDVAATLLGAIEGETVRSAVVADDLAEARDGLLAALQNAGIKLLKAQTAADAEPADLGVSRAAFAVAETGSFCVLGSALTPRLPTMMPPIHVALVDSGTIYASLDEAADHLERAMAPNGEQPMRYASLVAGPSRTADVEKTLAVGVHGPRLVSVILVDPAA